jgi:propionyl-CoA carboxylase alpha chain
MNTRLQVEHPVTELITGLDLVELMIRVANGEKLPITQDDVTINGWAMECRVYAESPYRNFLPSTGRLRGYQPPPSGDHVRIDAGVVEGSEISMYYDPMIAKLVTWGESRDQAIEKMIESLDQYYIRGVDTNLPFVSAIMQHPRFKAGDLTTGFIAEEYPDGFGIQQVDGNLVNQLVCVLATIHHRLIHRAATVSNQVEGYGRKVSTQWTVVIDGQNHQVSIDSQPECWKVNLDGKEYIVEDHWLPTQQVYAGKVDGDPLYLQVEKSGVSYNVVCGAFADTIRVMTSPTARLNELMLEKQAPDMSRFLLSPMPGLLVSLSVEAGQAVKAGQELAVIEAMKMENSLKANHDCTVATVLAQPGQTLEVDQPIVEFESSS